MRVLPAVLGLGLILSATPRALVRADINGPMAAGQAAQSASAHIPPEENAAYQEAYGLYVGGRYAPALQKLSEFENAYPRSYLTGQVENLHGLAYLATQHAPQAIHHFEKALAAGQGSADFSQYVLYNLATAQFEAGQVEDAQKSLLQIHVDGLDKENRLKVRYLKSRVSLKRNQPLESAVECLEGSRLMSGVSQARETRTAFSMVLGQALEKLSDPAQLDGLYRDFDDSPLADQILHRLASLEVAAGARDKAESHARLLMSRFPDSAWYAQANDIAHGATPPGVAVSGAPTGQPVAGAVAAAPLKDVGPADPGVVGVLLPMKGKFARFGSKSLQGIELEFGIFSATDPDSKVTLAIEDSGEDAETAVKALDRLVLRHHSVAVIGPLLSKGVEQVTQRAAELGVPLVSLARHAGTQSDWVFQGGLTLRLQASEIARFAIEKLGLKRFAVLYPRDKVGEESEQRFWDAIESLGGKMVGVESYNPGETDFRQPVDKLSGLYYTEARSREVADLSKLREENKIKKRTRKTEQFYALKPIVDYDAVFIPDEPKVAGQILPTFAYRDVDHVKFLGTSAWNSPEFLARAQSYADSSLFLDAFYPESSSPVIRKFVERYRASFNQDPGAMDALAYDAAKVVQHALESGGMANLTRAELRDRLKGTRNLPGVTGKITYADGYLNRDLKILTAKAGRIIEAAALPEKASQKP